MGGGSASQIGGLAGVHPVVLLMQTGQLQFVLGRVIPLASLDPVGDGMLEGFYRGVLR